MLTAARQTWLPAWTWAAAASTVGLGAYYWQGNKLVLEVEAEAKKQGALDPNAFQPFKLIEKEKMTHNTSRYRFQLPEDQASGIYTASCLVVRAMVADKDGESPKAVVRPYTPTSSPDAKGYLDLVVKTYPQGKISKYMDDLKIGDELEIKGPIPKFPYEPNMKKNIGLIAGGTGITPCMQMIEAILNNPDDKTKVSLIYANITDEDILFKKKLDWYAHYYRDRFRVYYVVERAKWGGTLWKGGMHYITKNDIKDYMPPPDKDNLVMVCGPPGMMEHISGNKAKDFTQGELKGMLKDLEYAPSMVFKF